MVVYPFADSNGLHCNKCHSTDLCCRVLNIGSTKELQFYCEKDSNGPKLHFIGNVYTIHGCINKTSNNPSVYNIVKQQLINIANHDLQGSDLTYALQEINNAF